MFNLTPWALPQDYKALVIGSGGAIGGAFATHFQHDPLCGHVELISRSHTTGFDLADAQSIERHAKAVASSGPFHVIVDATGALTIDGRGPEKALAAMREDLLLQSFHLNAVGPALLLRHLSPLLAPGPAVYAKLSARVGSIADNHKGGWYGYRASKAAMNMILQTAAIELQRRNPDLRVVALQPGTVRSNLSKPFTAHVAHLLDAEKSVAGMVEALKNLAPKSGAHFVDYKGQDIPW